MKRHESHKQRVSMAGINAVIKRMVGGMGLTETPSLVPHRRVGSIPSYVRTDGAGGVFLRVRASPGARKNAVEGEHDEALRIRVAAPPVDGKANKALVAFLAKTLSLPKRNIRLQKGGKSRDKTFAIVGLNPEDVVERLATAR